MLTLLVLFARTSIFGGVDRAHVRQIRVIS